MRKLNLLLGALSGLFILYLSYLDNRGEELGRQLTADRLQCKQQVERLRSDHQAEIDDLQQYLQNQYNYTPQAGAAQQRVPMQERQSGESVREHTQKVDRKYRYMYEDLPDLRDSAKEMLQQLLLEREQLKESGTLDPVQQAEIEAQIGELLGAAGYQQYQVLKNSDIEQHHLDEYASGISSYAPITPEQDKALLYARLRHKQIYEMSLRDSGIYQERLTPEESQHAYSVIRHALEVYKNNYLQEAKQFLNDEQFKMLKNYETTEFDWELERLQKQIDAKE